MLICGNGHGKLEVFSVAKKVGGQWLYLSCKKCSYMVETFVRKMEIKKGGDISRLISEKGRVCVLCLQDVKEIIIKKEGVLNESFV